jgi:FkbM family methyltransferase
MPHNPARTAAYRFPVYFLAAAVPLALLIAAVQSRHAPLVLSHYMRGRAGTCSLRESFEAEALSRLQYSNAAETRAATRLVRKDGSYSLWSTPGGQFWMPSASGDALVYDLAEQKRNIYGTGMRPGDIVLDCGANIGVFTRKALWAGASKVIAIEPAPENLECLRRNFQSEIATGKVVAYPKGVWDKDDVLKLAVDPSNSAQDTFLKQGENRESVEVSLTTIDKLVAELQLPDVGFIKMDIEGAERRAIAGARTTIARYHPRMALSIYHLKGDDTAIPGLVGQIDPRYSLRQTCLCASDRIQPEVAFFF